MYMSVPTYFIRSCVRYIHARRLRAEAANVYDIIYMILLL